MQSLLCIASHRFRGTVAPETIEAKILFDADKLDVLGAVGIARCYIFAGEHSEKIWSDRKIEEYSRENIVGGKPGGRIKDLIKHSANIEFETKLKHIPDRLYTTRAKEIAKDRVQVMDNFFESLRKELANEY